MFPLRSKIVISQGTNYKFVSTYRFDLKASIGLKKVGKSKLSVSTVIFNTFKYHVSCTDGKISVRINLLLKMLY